LLVAREACYLSSVDGIRLLFRRGEERLLQLRLDRLDITVGGGLQNDVVVPGAPELAARIHGRGPGRFRLVDRSGGALTVDGDPVRDGFADLSSGDTFALGDCVLEIHAETSRPSPRRRTDILERARDPSREAWLRHGTRAHRLDREDAFEIGHHEDNDLVLEDRFTSGFHARITHDGHAWRIEDLGSTNGTEVNALRVREAELVHGARIGIGGAELVFVTRSAPESEGPSGMIGASPAMQRVFEDVRKFADSPEAVVVTGASGTGKEGISRALHYASRRAGGPYLALNCGALASNLIESELFGHVRGAFTGADADKRGAFEAASGGTLFLDEVGELPLELQPKLLRVLETKTVRRVGGTEEIPVDTRVVAATHRNLQRLVEEGRFREDLFHRLFVLGIAVPNLAERPEDIEPLARHFIDEASRGARALTPAAFEALRRYDWPGNARELRNVLIRALASTSAPTIDAEDLLFTRDAFASAPPPGRATPETSEVDERVELEEALRATRGNRAAAARRLGMSKSTFYDKVRRLGIDPKKV
jgi:transcriptional regulator with AAA-type ATPase domain